MPVIEDGFTADRLANGVDAICAAAHAAITAFSNLAGASARQTQVNNHYAAMNAYINPNLTAPTLTA